jgi:hypothetical protein
MSGTRKWSDDGLGWSYFPCGVAMVCKGPQAIIGGSALRRSPGGPGKDSIVRPWIAALPLTQVYAWLPMVRRSRWARFTMTTG